MTLKKSEINTLAKRYAGALFEASEEKGHQDKILKDVESIKNVVLESDDLKFLINNPVFSKEERKSSILDLSKKLKFNELTQNLLLILNQYGRLTIINEVCDAYKDIISSKAAIINATVTSAKKLKVNEVKQIEKSLGESTGKKVECDIVVDKSIIGGLKIRIGAKLFDDSVSGKLERLRLKLAD